MPVSLASIEDARRKIAGTALRTPLVRLNGIDMPAEIYLKLENLQPIGSFKIRGAANAMAHLSPAQLQRGVLTASAGNMAQGVAWVARELDIPCHLWWRWKPPRNQAPGHRPTWRPGGSRFPFRSGGRRFRIAPIPGSMRRLSTPLTIRTSWPATASLGWRFWRTCQRWMRYADPLGRRRVDLRHRIGNTGEAVNVQALCGRGCHRTAPLSASLSAGSVQVSWIISALVR